MNKPSISRTDRLALLQRFTSTAAAASNTTPTHITNTLKSLLNIKDKQVGNAEGPTGETQFKPIYKIKSEDIMSQKGNDTAYESSNENDYEDELVHKQACSMSNTTVSSGSPGCTSPAPILPASSTSSAYEPINTADIAQKVRDLLSIHNIGQRVFAKFILGLSQGTVSELLSKPKHWDKLTEKGRESYRKMYTWSCSEQSIATLKAISPRKGNKDNYFYQNGLKEDSATEERIAHILSEAQKEMQAKDNSASSPSPSMSSGSPSMSPISNKAKTSCFNESKDALNETCETEEDLMMTDENSNDEEPEPEHKKPVKRFNDDSCPLDLTVKTQKVSKTTLATAPGLHTKKIKLESDFSDAENYGNESKKHFMNNANNLMSAALNQSNSSSPLKHIQSIAESYLMNQYDSAALNQAGFKSTFGLQPSPTSSSPFQRPSSTPSPSLSINNNNNNNSTSNSTNKTLKCVLPPVSQEQFDKYSLINTEELVKKVKDLLSKFSISQRLFGECILGLSQGTVSELLSKPKPWNTLSIKGREPYLRMYMWLNDFMRLEKLNEWKEEKNRKFNHD